MSEAIHPCLNCGVCCETYRVEFSVYELHSQGGCVPDDLAHAISGNRWRMNGTDYHPVRCEALSGQCGQQVACSIYEQRSSTCRNFEMGSERCNQARARHALAPIDALEQALWLTVP